MRELRRDIRTAMIGAEGFKAEHLRGIRDEITRVIGRFETRMNAMVTGNQAGAWEMGVQMIDNPLAAAEVSAAMPLLTETQLITLQGFSADLITGITQGMRTRINSVVSLAVAGEKNVYQAAKEVDSVLGIAKRKGVTGRAMRIARTEIGRAQSIATQLRMEQAKERVPGLKKQWFTGINPRPSHAAANGQVVDVKDFFIVGGHKAMEPKDPRLPVEEVANCNCTHGPYLEELE